MTAPVLSTRRLFAREVAQSEPEIDLAKSALLIAKEQYPQLSVDLYRLRLDQLAEEVRDRLGEESAPPVVLQDLVHTLFERHGFKGNRDAYYDPRNSFLNDVLDRRLGIPLTLGIVLLEVGWRLGLPLEGVDFPNHFIVRLRGDAFSLLIDPFEAGQTVFEDQAQEILDRVHGGGLQMAASFLKTATRRDMLARMLRNLKRLFVSLGDHARALASVERILLVRPERVIEKRAEGILLARLGRRPEALERLRAYLDVTPPSEDRERVRRLMELLRAGASPFPMDPEEET